MMKLAESAKNILIGMLLGILLMMPGVCAATLAVIFGIYDRLIRDISKPTKYLKEDGWFVLTIVVVAIIGVYICAKVLDFLIDGYEIPLTLFFATAVSMQLPDIRRQADDGKRTTPYNLSALAIGFALMILFLYVGMTSHAADVAPGILMMVLAGMISGICILSPGLSSSTMLMALGLFPAVISALSALDFSAIIPMAIGLALGILLFAKIVDHFMTENRKSTYFAIIGLTAGSIAAVVIRALMAISGNEQIVQCVVAVAAGVALGWCTHLFTRKYVTSRRSFAWRHMLRRG